MADPSGQPAQEQNIFASFVSSALRIGFFYIAFTSLFPSSTIKTKTNTEYSAIWNLDEPTDLQVHLSMSPHFDTDAWLVWKEEDIAFGNWNDIRRKSISIPCSSHLKGNGSLYSHSFVTRSKNHKLSYNILVAGSRNETVDVLYHRKLLTRFMAKRKIVKKRNLVSADDQDMELNSTSSEPETQSIVSHWWTNFTLIIVANQSPIPVNTPPIIMQQTRLTPDNVSYLPQLSTNDFWMLHSSLIELNSTVETLELDMIYSPIEFWKYQMYLQFQESMKTQVEMLGSDVREMDQMKSMFLDTNPILLAITFFVSILHSIFDFLAFKNDIDFWKQRKNMEGLSFRTIVLNIVQQLIIFLYLLDNDTSSMILISTFIALVIECWKINKTVIFKKSTKFPYFDLIDRVAPSKLVKQTREYDAEAFGYLGYLLIPLLTGYTIYSVYYEEHKGWYSFIVGTLVGFVYLFGFISMTPQLFINYKLKSVAHMPWKTFMYKSLNTFIDDLFAFVIKMPLMHRIACLRDDVVFFVYLYQRWKYPEDKRRRNEFGQVGEDDVDAEDTLIAGTKVGDSDVIIESKKDK